MTMPAALSARIIAASASAAARGLREEDDPLGVARDLVEVAHHPRLTAPGRARRRYRRPHALVELVSEGLDQLELLLGHRDVALREEHLPMTGLHPQQPHRLGPIMSKRSVAVASTRARRPDQARGTFIVGPAEQSLRKGSRVIATLGDRRGGSPGAVMCPIATPSKFFVLYRADPDEEPVGDFLVR